MIQFDFERYVLLANDPKVIGSTSIFWRLDFPENLGDVKEKPE